MSAEMIAVLTAARDLISDPARWTQKDFARDADGHSISPLDPDAASWCAVGAVVRLTNQGVGLDALRALRSAVLIFDPPDIHELNDTGNHETVMALFDRAIELANWRRTAGSHA